MSSTSQVITVLIVDDQGLVRDGFTRIVDAQPAMRVVGVASNGREAIALARARRPDVILMDVRMPGVDGIEATGTIVQEDGSIRVLGLTIFDNDAYAVRMLKAGATGFVLKDSTADQLVDAIRSAHHGTLTVAPATGRRLLRRLVEHEAPRRGAPALRELTDREATVFRLVTSGMSNLEIAQHLCISEVTVKSHVGRVLSKLGARDRVQLVLWAHRNGVLPVSSESAGGPEGPGGGDASDRGV